MDPKEIVRRIGIGNFSEKELPLVLDVLSSRELTLTFDLRGCESPIERLALLGFMAADWYRPESISVTHPDAWGRIVAAGVMGGAAIFTSHMSTADLLLLQPTVVIDDRQYRPDLTFFSAIHRYAVELDGHDFHERTKEQATRDKKRDRAFTAAGWRVLRFSGSEVWGDPGCVCKAIEGFARKDMAEACERPERAGLLERL